MKAADIRNARARSWWEGQVQVQQVMWEGNLDAAMTTSNAAMQAAGSMMSNTLSYQAGMESLSNRLSSNQSAIRVSQENYSYAQSQNLMNGLFSAAQSGASAYYRSKPVGTEGQFTSLLADSGGRADFDAGYGNNYFDVWGE
jgi:hypothetical protein